jgi:hypothetical protein
MTSNLGADRIRQHASKESFEQLKQDLMEILSHSFRPEFINRIDEIIVFRALTEEQIAEITVAAPAAVRRLRASMSRSSSQTRPLPCYRMRASTPSTARGRCAGRSNGSSRTASRMLLNGDIEPGDRVTVDVTEGDLQFEVERGAHARGERLVDEAEEAKTPKSTGAGSAARPIDSPTTDRPRRVVAPGRTRRNGRIAETSSRISAQYDGVIGGPSSGSIDCRHRCLRQSLAAARRKLLAAD